jgi:hypothetical protein
MPSYSTPGADLLTANIMRSVETEEHSEALDSTVQRQSEPGRAAVAAVAPPIVSIPVVQPNSVGIQRQCSECAEKQQQPSEEEGKDVLEKSQAASGIQTKLTVGAIGDAYEQEADRVAAQVMSMPVAAAAPRQVQRFGEELVRLGCTRRWHGRLRLWCTGGWMSRCKCGSWCNGHLKQVGMKRLGI